MIISLLSFAECAGESAIKIGNIWRKYGEEYGGLVFVSQCSYVINELQLFFLGV